MGAKQSVQYKGIEIEHLPSPVIADKKIMTDLSMTVHILSDFIGYYKEHSQINLSVLDKLLNNMCIEDECLKRLTCVLNEDKNEHFYSENLYIFTAVQQLISSFNSHKNTTYARLEDVLSDAMLIFKFKRHLFFTYPFFFFCEFLKFATIAIVITHFITTTNTDNTIQLLYDFYYFLA